MTLLNTAIALSIITAGTQVATSIGTARAAKKRGKKAEEREIGRIAEEDRLKKQSAARIAKRRGVAPRGRIPRRADIRTSPIGITGNGAIGGKTLLGT